MLDARYVQIRGGCDQLAGMLTKSNLPGTKKRRFGSTAVLLPNEAVAVAGGVDQEGAPIKHIEVFVSDE